MSLSDVFEQICNDSHNAWAVKQGWKPVYTAHKDARILVVGQAPGIRAQTSGVPWNDQSGDNLRCWMSVTREIFYNASLFALIPMDFFFPGRGVRGDLPPRKHFAEKWHPRLLAEMPRIELTIVIGQHAHRYYLEKRRKMTVSDTVQRYAEYLPDLFPLVHPSPRNNIWQKKNPWFMKKVVPALQERVSGVLNR